MKLYCYISRLKSGTQWDDIWTLGFSLGVYLILIWVLILFFWPTDINAEILNGKILELNKEYSFVIINLGKEDGVKKEMVFMVYRDRKLLGKVEVEEVFQDMSSCIILPWFKKEGLKIDDGVLKP